MIHDESSPSQWRHIDTGTNPADDASRGLCAKEVVARKGWINGSLELLVQCMLIMQIPWTGIHVGTDFVKLFPGYCGSFTFESSRKNSSSFDSLVGQVSDHHSSRGSYAITNGSTYSQEDHCVFWNVLSLIRQRFWIPRARLLAKRVLRNCITYR